MNELQLMRRVRIRTGTWDQCAAWTGQPDVIAPFRQEVLRVHPTHELFPRPSRAEARPGPAAGGGPPVQLLGHLLEPGGELAVVDVSVLVRVEPVEQSLDLGFGHVELPAHHREIPELDLPGVVHIAGGKQPPETGAVHVLRFKTRDSWDKFLLWTDSGPLPQHKWEIKIRSLVQVSVWAGFHQWTQRSSSCCYRSMYSDNNCMELQWKEYRCSPLFVL